MRRRCVGGKQDACEWPRKIDSPTKPLATPLTTPVHFSTIVPVWLCYAHHASAKRKKNALKNQGGSLDNTVRYLSSTTTVQQRISSFPKTRINSGYVEKCMSFKWHKHEYMQPQKHTRVVLACVTHPSTMRSVIKETQKSKHKLNKRTTTAN